MKFTHCGIKFDVGIFHFFHFWSYCVGGALEIFPVCPDVDSLSWICIYSNIFIISTYHMKMLLWLDNQCVLFLNSTLDNGWIYLATGTIPVSNDFPRALYLWHRFFRVIFISFCQGWLQVMQTENRSKNTFSYPAFNFSNCNVTINYQQ